jgi:hypothetical protein
MFNEWHYTKNSDLYNIYIYVENYIKTVQSEEEGKLYVQ